MNSLSFPASFTSAESCNIVSGSCRYAKKDIFSTGLRFNLLNEVNKDWLRLLSLSHRRNICKFSVSARFKRGQKHDYPWPDKIDPNDGNHLKHLSRFKPLSQKPKPVILDFEKPLVELQKKITDVRKMAEETGLDFTDQINLLEIKYQEAVKDLYTHLTPFQRLNMARHPNRPTFLDHVMNITEKWVELHGDRAGYDDPALCTGLGSMDGKTYMFIGHQKGRNTKENIFRNFAMPTPHGYRKALRMMKYADHHGFPIITFIDTPGAFADLKSEELGQGEAIAQNLRSMFGFKVPIVSVVIGEGGSGGALAIGCANYLLMLENAVFYVASPEACAAILWKTSKAAPKAAEKLKITAQELVRLKIADGIIPEPLRGAHTDPAWTSQQIKLAVTKAMQELNEMDTDTLLDHRHMKFRKISGFRPIEPHERPSARRDAKKKVLAVSKPTDRSEATSKKVKKDPLKDEMSSESIVLSPENIKRAKQMAEKEMANAFISMGLKEKLDALKMDISKAPSAENLPPVLKERVDQLVQEFKSNYNKPGSYDGLKKKLKMLSGIDALLKNRAEAEAMKKEINEKLQSQAKDKMELLQSVRESLTKGEAVDTEKLREAIEAKDSLIELLKSANFEVVGVSSRLSPSAPPVLVEEAAKVGEVITKELKRAMDSTESKGKLAELRAELEKSDGKDVDKLESLIRELKEGVCKSLNIEDLMLEVNRAIDMSGPQEAIVSAVE